MIKNAIRKTEDLILVALKVIVWGTVIVGSLGATYGAFNYAFQNLGEHWPFIMIGVVALLCAGQGVIIALKELGLDKH